MKTKFVRSNNKYSFRYRKNATYFLIFFSATIAYIMLSRGYKSLDQHYVAEGTLINKQIVKETYKRDNFRYVFLFELDNTAKPFGITVASRESVLEGSNHWYSRLALGDQLKVYYDQKFFTKNDDTIRLIRQINRKAEIVFENRTKTDKILGFLFLGVSLFFVFLRIWSIKK